MSQVGGINGFSSVQYQKRAQHNGQVNFAGDYETASSRTRRSGSSNLIFTLGAAALLTAGFFAFKGKLPGVSGAINSVKNFFTNGAVGNFFKNNSIGKFFANIGTQVKNGLNYLKQYIPGLGKSAGQTAGNAGSKVATAPTVIIKPPQPPVEQVLSKAARVAHNATGTTTQSGLFIPDADSVGKTLKLFA